MDKPSSIGSRAVVILHFLFFSSLFQPSWSFLSQPRSRPLTTLRRSPLPSLSSSANDNDNNNDASSSLEIVLFGTGDLRTTDHGGLSKALSSFSSMSTSPTATTKVLPLFIMDTKDTLPNMPMGRTHLIDNASILHASLASLQKQLKSKYDLDLHLCVGQNKKEGVVECLNRVIQNLVLSNDDDDDDDNNKTDTSFSFSKVTIHSCDLGDVDNHLSYGPLQHLTSNIDSMISMVTSKDGDVLDIDVNVEKWDCSLRAQPWDDLSLDSGGDFPSLFPDYQKKYESTANVNKIYVDPRDDIDQTMKEKGLGLTTIPSMIDNIPSVEEISNLLCTALDLEKGNEDDESRCTIRNQINTGLYATHWGGLDVSSTMDEDCLLKAIDIFLNDHVDVSTGTGTGTCTGTSTSTTTSEGGDEALVETLKWWSSNSNECKLKRNPKSLEHASMNWLMTGGSETSSATATPVIKTKSLIEGELLTRYLAAPLLFGTVSLRYLWQRSEEVSKKKQSPFDIFGSQARANTEFLQDMAENREWHKLFAAKNLRSMNNSQGSSNDEVSYDYFRWHGYLCRYGSKNSSNAENERDGVVLVHGFGASGSQWEKTITELEKLIGGDAGIEALAPDLIGFGQCEKPPITYTQYLWEGYTADCVKEVGLGSRNWRSFVIGGNSIGGYTAMGAAADDIRTESDSNDVSSLGTIGSGKAKGLVLMNSAGRILSRDEINESETTIAEATALDLLGENSPPPRTLAKVGGNGLLWYLRPRIQSICKNLYPTNPDAVDNNLCGGILRDSLDPGAINVMISGSKLPPPRTANELLGADFGSSKSKGSSRVREGSFDGPVLVAQGILDPLNDARQRANMLEALRPGITVSRMDAGHCPHDELPDTTAKFISEWMETSMSNTGAKVMS